MAEDGPKQVPQLVHFLTVRLAVGGLGAALPLVMLLGVAVSDDVAMQPTISDFYWTPMRDLFVGILCAIGCFLITYQGYAKKPGEILTDRATRTVACFTAVGVALLPTAPACASDAQAVVGWLHLACAATFFAAVGLFALVLFPRGSDQALNKVYVTCGAVIFLCLAALGLLVVLYGKEASSGTRVFWLETAAVLAFGISWLVKGWDALRKERRESAGAGASAPG